MSNEYKFGAILQCSDGKQFKLAPNADLHSKSIIRYRGMTFIYQYIVHGEALMMYGEVPAENQIDLPDDAAETM